MAKHELRAKLPQVTIQKSDLVVDVWADGEKLGRLKVSRGSVEWTPRDHTYGHHLSWEEFDGLMVEHGVK